MSEPKLTRRQWEARGGTVVDIEQVVRHQVQNSSESLLRGYHAASSQIGMRGALHKLLERAVGDGS